MPSLRYCRYIGLPILFALLMPLIANAEDRLRGAITSAPEAIRIGAPFRVTGVLFNGSNRPQRVVVSIYTIRPWGEHVKLGETIVEIRANERKVVGIPCIASRDVEPGPHSIGMVIRSEHGRFIADTRLIRILPPLGPPR